MNLHEDLSEDCERTRSVPESELRFIFARSGGKGGQNVNKRDTKATAYWPVDKSQEFSDKEKALIKEVLENRINNDGELFIVAQEARTQEENRKRAIARLNQLVADALVVATKRVATEPTKHEARISDKKQHGIKKQGRQKVSWDNE